jgi:hypothetical protein
MHSGLQGCEHCYFCKNPKPVSEVRDNEGGTKGLARPHCRIPG